MCWISTFGAELKNELTSFFSIFVFAVSAGGVVTSADVTVAEVAT
jgi:hypothetical protein